MFAIFAIIIAIIVFILRGLGGAPVSPVVVVAQQPLMRDDASLDISNTVNTPSDVPIIPITIDVPRKRARRNVSFAPRTEIREFNVNGGEITGQYSKAIGS